MRIPKIYWLLLVILLFTYCSKDNTLEPDDLINAEEPMPEPNPEPEPEPNPEPIVYFTFTVDESIDTFQEDNWILIHNENGVLLDYKAYETGDTLEFEALESTLTDYVHISLFTHHISYFLDENNQLQEGDSHDGLTFPKIPLKTHWTQGDYPEVLSPSTTLTNNGQFSISLSNFNHYDKIYNSNSIGSGQGNLSTVGSLYLSGSSAYYPSTSTFEINGVTNYAENPEYLWTFLEHDDYEFKYAFFEDPEDGVNVNLDYNDFNAFSEVKHLPVLPDNLEYDFWQFGYETETSFKSNAGYLLLWLRLSPDLGGNGIPIGTLNRFNYYKTRLSYRTEEFTYFYKQDGPALNVESFPAKPEITSTGSINSLETSIDTDYVRREDVWIGKNESSGNFNATNWKIICDDNTYPTLAEFPEELINQYPSIVPWDELTRSSTDIYLQGDSYRGHLNRLFDPTFDHLIQDGFTDEYFHILE